MKIDLDSLKGIIKSIRDERFQSVPDSVIDDILYSASEHQDDPAASLPEIRTIVENHIKTK